MQLTPCPACRRHVADALCVFCGARVAASAPVDSPLGRVSRAMVMGAALIGGGASCGGKAKQADPQTMPEGRPFHHNHPCTTPDAEEIAALEKKKEEAATDDEKMAIDRDLQKARQPMCAPYGAPPARRRVV